MSMTSSTRLASAAARALAKAAVASLALSAAAAPARAQLTVFDPANHVENALQTARQLQSLTNETQMLLNQARQLAASPYSHLLQSSQTLADISALARNLEGMSGELGRMDDQFQALYPAAIEGLDPKSAAAQAQARALAARATARDLATTAAELERLAEGRASRLHGALAASQAAEGETAAIQSSTQMLSVLAEDLGAARAVLLAQSRLMAETAARRASDQAAAAEARRQYYGRPASQVAAPAFDPFPHARR